MRYFMLRKCILSFVLLIVFSNLFGQKNDVIKNELNKKIIDSLQYEIYQDTVKFNEKDLVFTQIGRKNINSYSMLYVVNGTYMYKLDIISSDKVIEFVNEFLDADKVKDIVILPKEKAMSIFGSLASNGIVAIVLRQKT